MVMTSRERHRLGSAWTTYYEHRVFMVYLPNDFRDYLGRVATGERDWMRNPRSLDLMAWGTVLTYQARMEPFRFNEVLNRYYEGNGNFRKGYDEEGTPLWQPMFRLQLTMQLAQEVVINHASIEGRIDEYPTQAQMLFDTLHYVTKLHSDENPADPGFTISKDNLRAYLRQRAENDRGPGLDLDFPGPARLALLLNELWLYLHLLAKPADLRDRALTDSRLLRRSTQERQLRTRLVRAILPDETPVIGDLVPARSPAEESPPAEEIRFRFLINRFGIDPYDLDKADPLGKVREDGTALRLALASWERLLSQLFGRPDTGQRAAAAAGILEQTPSWEAIARARALVSDLLSDRAEAVASEAVSRPEEEERGRRVAAEQLQAALRMLNAWRDAFREGVLAAKVAALAVPSGDWPTRRRIALEALGNFCRLDLKEQPADVLKFLQKELVWPPVVPAQRELSLEDSKSASSFVENPEALESYCRDLTPPDAGGEQQVTTVDRPAPTPAGPFLIRDEREATAVDWPALWSNFWSLWEFRPTIVTLRRRSDTSAATESASSDTPTTAGSAQSGAPEARGSTPPDAPAVADAAATGLAVLHAARHGGIPVIPSLRATLSIGQWWRLVTLAVFGDESIPDEAVSAALRALGFPHDLKSLPKNSLSHFPARPAGDVPVLFVSISSAASPAWSWPSNSRAAVIMPPPPDVVKADGAAISKPDLVAQEFSVLRHNAKTQAQIFSLREFLLRLLLLRKRRARNLNFIECREIGPDFDSSHRTDPDVYLFGFGTAQTGVAGVIASPTGVADLLQRIRDMDQRRQSG